MKRCILFLGLSIALGLGLSSSLKADSKALTYCCDLTSARCGGVSGAYVYGPRVASLDLCNF